MYTEFVSLAKGIFFLKQSVGLLLTMSENQQVASILLPPLIDIGLPNVLFNLLAYEMSRLTSEKNPERYS